MIAKWFIVGLVALSSLLVIGSVGKPRKPITPGSAATTVAINALFIVLIVVFWDAS